MKVEWLKDKKYDENCLRPLPFDEDGVFEKELMVEALKRNYKEDPDYNTLSIKKPNFDENINLSQSRDSKGVIKIIYKEEGIDLRDSPLKSWNHRRLHSENDEFMQCKINKKLGLFITREICRKMGGNLEVFTES